MVPIPGSFTVADGSVDRARGRALSSPNKLKLGVFAANLSGGTGAITMSDGPPRIANWAEVRGTAVLADQVGFEVMVPVSRWKGFDGPSGFWDRCLETFTWGAGIAEATERIQIFTTCHAPVFHPVMAAKMGTTLDFISEGRWGLNIVAGWLASEFELFGQKMAPHAERYTYAQEWVEMVKRLWSEDEEFDVEGTYFTMKGAISKPKPVQRPLPAIMNAGLSPAGQKFAVTNADMIFINLGDMAGTETTIANVRDTAATLGRDVAIWGNVHIVCRSTEQEARDYIADYVDAHGDLESAKRFAASMLGGDAASKAVWEADPNLLRNLIATSGNLPIVGTPEQVVARLKAISDLGIDGVNIAWPDYDAGLRQYRDELFPLMREAGLRTDEDPIVDRANQRTGT